MLEEAMGFFGDSYPRGQEERRERLAEVPGDKREEWDPFSTLDDRFYGWLHEEKNRWEQAADDYARRAGA